MGKYSIKELEKLSGIKAHTIRIWEKRYNLVEPLRTSTNVRFYSDQDLVKIINVSTLNNSGIKISNIAAMSEGEISQRILALSETENDGALHIDQLVLAMVSLDEELFDKTLHKLILHHGFEKTIIEFVYPFLKKIGVLWLSHNITPAHEHFISNLIRQKIIVAIDGLSLPPKDAKRIVLFLPEGEMHELGLLFYHFLAKKAGYRTYYMGQNLPHIDLVKTCDVYKPDKIITSLISPLPIDDYLAKLSHDFPGIYILAGGGQLQGFNSKNRNIHIFSSAQELQNHL